MGKLEKIYDSLKQDDPDKIYLIKSGNFYLFLNDDAVKMGDIFSFKIASFGNECKKCGFPVNSLKKYNILFEKLALPVMVVDDEVINVKSKIVSDNHENIIKKLKQIDINVVTPIDALNILKELTDLV